MNARINVRKWLDKYSAPKPKRKRGPKPADNLVAKKRFEDKIFYSPDGCWYWLGTTDKFGYGLVRVNSTAYAAHRLSYLLFIGPIPDKMFVCHHCDNPYCVNPNHLFVGTHQDNMNDMISKNRAYWQKRT